MNKEENKKRFLSLVSDEKTDTLERNIYRIKNRQKIRESQQIAIEQFKKIDGIK